MRNQRLICSANEEFFKQAYFAKYSNNGMFALQMKPFGVNVAKKGVLTSLLC